MPSETPAVRLAEMDCPALAAGFAAECFSPPMSSVQTNQRRRNRQAESLNNETGSRARLCMRNDHVREINSN